MATSYHWTPEEDKQLLQLVQEHGAKDWRRIAENVPGKDSNQCWHRWHHHLNPDINHGPWSEDEDKILMDNHKELRSKWSDYMTLLPGRTSEAIKHRLRRLRLMRSNEAAADTEKNRLRLVQVSPVLPFGLDAFLIFFFYF